MRAFMSVASCFRSCLRRGASLPFVCKGFVRSTVSRIIRLSGSPRPESGEAMPDRGSYILDLSAAPMVHWQLGETIGTTFFL